MHLVTAVQRYATSYISRCTTKVNDCVSIRQMFDDALTYGLPAPLARVLSPLCAGAELSCRAWMNGWICRTTAKTPLIVVRTTSEHAFTARPGRLDRRPNAAAAVKAAAAAAAERPGSGCGCKCRRSKVISEMYVCLHNLSVSLSPTAAAERRAIAVVVILITRCRLVSTPACKYFHYITELTLLRCWNSYSHHHRYHHHHHQ